MKNEITQVSKLSEITETGFYYMESTEERLPLMSDALIEWIKFTFDEQIVRIRKYKTDNPRIYQRSYKNGVWSKWMYLNDNSLWDFLDY